MSRGAGAGGLLTDGAEGCVVAGGAAGAEATGAGFFSTTGGGVTGRGAGGAAAAVCCLVISFRTSPGLEMCERSILVLISSASARDVRTLFDAPCASAAPRKCARTFSASCSSIELE
jgi:hypothetical protein